MPTVIDSLVVTLGLDASKFTEEQKKAVESLRQFQDSATKHTKPVQKGMDDLVGTFKEMQGRLLAIGAIIATGLGFNRLVQDVTKLNTELGFTSKTLGITAQQLSEWEQVGRTVGASSGEISQNLKSLNAEIQEFHATGTSKLGAFMGQVGIKPLQPNDTPDEVAKRLSGWYQGQSNKAYAGHLLQSRGGLSQGMVNLLSLGPEEIQKRLDQAKRFAPTDEEIGKFTKLTQAFGELLNVIERLTTKAILPFVTALTKILSMLTDWLGKWAENNQTPAEAAGEGFGKLGMPELKQNPSKPGLFQRGWNWLRGTPSGGAGAGASGGGGANDNAPGGAGAGSRPGGSPDSGQATGAMSGTLAGQRAGFMRELEQNPGLRDKVMRIAANEQGSNPNGTQAVIESMMNRAVVRGTNLETQARWYGGERGGYYAMGNMGRGALENSAQRAILERSLANAGAGSNASNYATDNSSGGLAARERASGSFRYRKDYTGETFFAPGTAEPGLAQKYDRWLQSTTAAEGAGGSRPRVGITLPGSDGLNGTQRSFENWRSLGLGARGAAMGGPQSSISNSNSSATHIGNLNVTTPPGASASAYADGIQRRLGDYNNVQNSNTGMV